MGDPIDSGILKLLDRRQDSVVRKGLSIEITPETAEDAYGGWWVSVYDEEKLGKARATPKEIEDISVEREAVVERTPPRQPPAQPERPAQARTASARPAMAKDRADLADDLWRGWAQSDMRESRQPKSSAGGRVYVRGYYRKNGTYVRAHTRRASR